MNRIGPILAAGVAALVLAAPAAAALEVRLSVAPAGPKPGSAATVRLRPYWTYNRPDGSCCRLVPADTTYPFRIEAVSPAGRAVRIPVRRTKDRYVWSGRFVFRTPGRWTIRAPQWGPAFSTHFGAKPRLRVSVRR